MSKKVIGIDPGNEGAFVLTDGVNFLETFLMPVEKVGKDNLISFSKVVFILRSFVSKFGTSHVFLERAMPMAMGAKGAFTYGRGFEALRIALGCLKLPFTMVEPSKWSKEMHEGISADLKPKAKSLIAVQRLYPQLVGKLPKRPKKQNYMDGPIDALLIAGYGLRKFKSEEQNDENLDFYDYTRYS